MRGASGGSLAFSLESRLTTKYYHFFEHLDNLTINGRYYPFTIIAAIITEL